MTQKQAQPAGKPTAGTVWTDQASVVARQGLSIQEARKTLEQFRAACRNPSDSADRLDELAQTLQDAGFRHEMSDIITDALRSDSVNPQVGALWVRRIVSSKVWDRKYPAYLDELVERGEIGTRALVEFVKYLTTKSRPRVAKKLFAKHGRSLREMPGMTEPCVAAMARAGLFRKVLAWSADWQREELPVSILYARAAALRGLGKERQAARVVDAALARDGLAQFPLLGLWKASEEALAGHTETAAKFYDALKPSGWDDDTFCLYYLTRGVIRVQQASPKSRKDVFRSSAARVLDRFGRHRVYRRHWTLRRAYRRCMGRMARDAGLWLRSMAVPWSSADSYSMLLPLALIPPLQMCLPTYLWRLLRKRNQPSR